MADNSFIKMCIQYAKKRGGGMPLTAQEFCNAVYLYAKNELKLTNAELKELAGKINPAVELVNQLEVKVEALNIEVETYSAGIDQAQKTANQAKTTATSALTNAISASANADEAKSLATTAQNGVDSLNDKVMEVEATANSANNSAVKAQSTAEQAASKADGALSNSVTANATANEALRKVNAIVVPSVSAGNGIDVTNESGDYTVSIDIVDLADIIQGSDSVVIDLNEAQTALEVHLDGELVTKIQRALTLPTSAPAKDSVVVVTTGNAQTLKPLSDIGGKVYDHKITFNINRQLGNNTDSTNYLAEIHVYDNSATPKQRTWFSPYIQSNQCVGYVTTVTSTDNYEHFATALFRTNTGSNVIITLYGRRIGGNAWQAYTIITDNIVNFTDTVTEL